MRSTNPPSLAGAWKHDLLAVCTERSQRTCGISNADGSKSADMYQLVPAAERTSTSQDVSGHVPLLKAVRMRLVPQALFALCTQDQPKATATGVGSSSSPRIRLTLCTDLPKQQHFGYVLRVFTIFTTQESAQHESECGCQTAINQTLSHPPGRRNERQFPERITTRSKGTGH